MTKARRFSSADRCSYSASRLPNKLMLFVGNVTLTKGERRKEGNGEIRKEGKEVRWKEGEGEKWEDAKGERGKKARQK